ncbi:hypothetical protein GCM10009588_31150 [Microbacterium phyllosphaerae]
MTKILANKISLQAGPAAPVGTDDLTDAERTALAMVSARNQARTPRSRELVAAWRDRKRAA